MFSFAKAERKGRKAWREFCRVVHLRLCEKIPGRLIGLPVRPLRRLFFTHRARGKRRGAWAALWPRDLPAEQNQLRKFTMDISQFSLRHTSSKATALPSKAIDGGLRVHIPSKHLTSTGLKTGDYCQLDQADGTRRAVGVAWLAKDPGNQNSKRMAFIEEPMKELYGLRLEDKVAITKLEPQQLKHAQKIYVKELEPGSSNALKEEIEFWAKASLCMCTHDFLASRLEFIIAPSEMSIYHAS